MKLRNKFFTGFVVAVLTIVMMVGSVFASTKKLPFNYPTTANAKTNNDVWVKVIGGGAGEAISNEKIAHQIKSVDVTFTGKCTFGAEIVYNSNFGWKSMVKKGVKVNGKVKINRLMDGADTTWCECVVNCQGKTKGKLAVTKMEFKDAKGKVILTWGK